jgi:hypothetical protein
MENGEHAEKIHKFGKFYCDSRKRIIDLGRYSGRTCRYMPGQCGAPDYGTFSAHSPSFLPVIKRRCLVQEADAGTVFV